jgi:NAD(P)-dependent dehydrogenase (short-subunit alcohol dehydrogenase family)
MTQTATQQIESEKAVITGGGTGIGRAAALALATEGDEVTVAGRTAATLEQTVELVTDAGGRAQYVIADVHDEGAVRHAVEVAAGESGRLDVAVNSAAVDCQHLLGCRPRRRSRLLGIRGLEARRDRSDQERRPGLRGRHVRVNAVCPGLVNTPLIGDMVSENPAMPDQLVASHPLGRIAEPEEVADAIIYLATSTPSYVTGVALPVDGGYLAR